MTVPKISNEEIRASSSGAVTTQKVTTPKNAVKVSTTTTKTTADSPDAGKAEQERANTVDPEISGGITTQVEWINELIYEKDVTKSGNTYKFTLKYHPYYTPTVRGHDGSAKEVISAEEWYKKTGVRKEQVYIGQRVKILSYPPSKNRDAFTMDGKEVTVIGEKYEYTGRKKAGKRTGVIFWVGYEFLDNYDPNYVSSSVV